VTETAAPLITIGLTCFNAADTIGRAIAAALKQDWPNLEIVIVDDCSKDNSTDVIDAYARQDQRVRLIRHEQNTGFAGALNTLIANAQGEFIAIFGRDSCDFSRIIRVFFAKGCFVLCPIWAITGCFASSTRPETT